MFIFATQEAKYVERWPNTTSAWSGWNRFDIPVNRYGRVHSLLHCTSITLVSPACHQASQQENTYWTKYQKADWASTLVTLCLPRRVRRPDLAGFISQSVSQTSGAGQETRPGQSARPGQSTRPGQSGRPGQSNNWGISQARPISQARSINQSRSTRQDQSASPGQPD